MALNNSKKDIVTSRIDEIKDLIGKGVPMGTIAKSIGVSKTTLYKHIADVDGGLNSLDTIKKYRQPAIDKIEAAMFNSAIGFTRKVKKFAKVRHCRYENGKKADEWEEMVEYVEEMYYPPDATSGIFLLKNWAGYANEPVTNGIRERELQLKEKTAEANNW